MQEFYKLICTYTRGDFQVVMYVFTLERLPSCSVRPSTRVVTSMTAAARASSTEVKACKPRLVITKLMLRPTSCHKNGMLL